MIIKKFRVKTFYNFYMKIFCVPFFVILSFLCSLQGFSQDPTGELKGYVYDETGFPLLGAQVILDGTSKGAVADIDGLFLIENIEPGTYNVTASFLGYETKTEFNVIIKSVGN